MRREVECARLFINSTAPSSNNESLYSINNSVANHVVYFKVYLIDVEIFRYHQSFGKQIIVLQTSLTCELRYIRSPVVN